MTCAITKSVQSKKMLSSMENMWHICTGMLCRTKWSLETNSVSPLGQSVNLRAVSQKMSSEIQWGCQNWVACCVSAGFVRSKILSLAGGRLAGNGEWKIVLAQLIQAGCFLPSLARTLLSWAEQLIALFQTIESFWDIWIIFLSYQDG